MTDDTPEIRYDLAGDHGRLHRNAEAVIDLCWDTERGWLLTATTRDTESAVPREEWHRIKLRYTLVRTDLLTLLDSDGPAIIHALGDDLPGLLARIDAGHSIELVHIDHKGCFTPDAAEADIALHDLIDSTHFDDYLPNTWSVDNWLGDTAITHTDTPETLQTSAETDNIRIWGGLIALRAAIDAS